MWKNIVDLERPQVTIWSVHISCGVPKATNTHPASLRMLNTQVDSQRNKVAPCLFENTEQRDFYHHGYIVIEK